MSLATWKKLYYRTPAKKAAAVDDLASIHQCLNKWLGLTEAALDAHGLIRSYDAIVVLGAERFDCGGDACSLCIRHRKGFACGSCPLAHDGTTCIPHWRAWLARGDARPMIDHIKSCIARLVAADPRTPKPGQYTRRIERRRKSGERYTTVQSRLVAGLDGMFITYRRTAKGRLYTCTLPAWLVWCGEGELSKPELASCA